MRQFSNAVSNNDQADENERFKEGDKVGGVTATADDELDEVFDPGATSDQLPKNDAEADAIRTAIAGGGIPVLQKMDPTWLETM